MNEATFRAMSRLALGEMHASTGIHAIPALGAVRSMGVTEGPRGAAPNPRPPRAGAPQAGPQAAHADPAVEKAILQATVELEKAMRTARAIIAPSFNAIRDMKDQHPQHEKLHMLLVVMQQGYELCHELEKMAQGELRHG